jgi:hypothetical protein
LDVDANGAWVCDGIRNHLRLHGEKDTTFRIIGRLVRIDDTRNVAFGVRRVGKCGPQLVDRRFAADLESEVLQLLLWGSLTEGEARDLGRGVLSVGIERFLHGDAAPRMTL